MKGIVIGIIVVLIVLAGGWYLMSGTKGTGGVISGNTVALTENVKTFVVEGKNLKFYIDGVENPDIVVNEGDRVRIELLVSDMMHDWKVDELNAATKVVGTGKTTSVEFVADKKGTFEYYCSVGQHRTNGMKGKIIVQ